MDEPQQRFGQQQGARRHKNPQRGAEPYAIPEKLLESLWVLRAHRLGQRNAKPDAGALHKAQRHKIQRIGGAHRGQRLLADQAAHHGGVHKGIKLLKQRAHHQWKREEQNLPDGPSLRQIHSALGCHENSSPCFFLCFSVYR